MFGYPRRKAIGQAVRILKPHIDAFVASRGSSQGFWEHPFVLGFVGAVAALATDHAYRGAANVEQKAMVLFGVFEELSGLGRHVMSRPYLAYSRAAHADFLAGGDNAGKLWHFLNNRLPKEREDADVIAATRLATGEGDGASPSREAIGRGLGALLFENVVARRLGEKA